MTLLRILAFAIRICGIFLFIDGFGNLGFKAIPFVQSGLALKQFSSYLVIDAVFLFIYILMIFIPVPIAKLLLPRVDIVAGFSRRPIENLEVIGCSLIGIYLFTGAVADLSYLMTLYQKSGVSEGEGSVWEARNSAQLVSALVQLFFSFVLVFGGGRIVSFLGRMRS